MKSAIYFIEHIKTGCRYVGSAINSERRQKQHLSDLRNNAHFNPLLQRSWNKYGEGQFRFGVLEWIDDPVQLVPREQHWIDSTPLKFNLCPAAGSALGRSCRPETIERMSAAARGRQFSEETRARMSAVAKGRIISRETRDKIGAANKGRIKTREERDRLSAGKTNPPDSTRRKLSEAMKRRHAEGRAPVATARSEETRAKISAVKRERNQLKREARTRPKTQPYLPGMNGDVPEDGNR
jgi:group I intron endonuclease